LRAAIVAKKIAPKTDGRLRRLDKIKNQKPIAIDFGELVRQAAVLQK